MAWMWSCWCWGGRGGCTPGASLTQEGLRVDMHYAGQEVGERLSRPRLCQADQVTPQQRHGPPLGLDGRRLLEPRLQHFCQHVLCAAQPMCGLVRRVLQWQSVWLGWAAVEWAGAASRTWEGCLVERGDRLGYAFTVDVDLPGLAVAVDLLVGASGDKGVLMVEVFLKRGQVAEVLTGQADAVQITAGLESSPSPSIVATPAPSMIPAPAPATSVVPTPATSVRAGPAKLMGAGGRSEPRSIAI